LEIFTDREGEVIFKKYSPMGELTTLAEVYCDVLAKTTSRAVAVCDRDHCIAAAGLPKREVLERRLTPYMEELSENRKNYILNDKTKNFTAFEGIDFIVSVSSPIISAGDLAGTVILLSKEGENELPTESEIKLTQVAAGVLGKNLEE
jgi:AbrB family transcriptional regulator (stage V sporulation protein T)